MLTLLAKLCARFAQPARTRRSSAPLLQELVLYVQQERILWAGLQSAPSVHPDISILQQDRRLKVLAQFALRDPTLH